MAYIPFIYFTLMLVWYWNKYHTLGVGFVAIAWIDLTSFFSILIDIRDLYGEMGVNDYAITPAYSLIYCLLWTIVLLPITKLDNPNFTISIRKTKLFRLLCYFLCLMVLIQLVFGDFIDLLQNGLSFSGAENYEMAKEDSRNYQSRGQFWLWIPSIISNGFPLIILCWFISITICPVKKWLQSSLLALSTVKMVMGFLTGGRSQFIWWIVTFLLLLAFFRRYMAPRIKKRIAIVFLIFSIVALIGLLSITFSRFDAGAEYAINSLICYAGQTYNNFCALLPYADLITLRIERVFPLTNLLINHTHLGLIEYYELISDDYWILINVFFPFFGSIIFDAGILGSIILIFIYVLTYYFFVIPRKKTCIDFSSLIIFALMTSYISQGIFHYPFAYHTNTAYALFSFMLYFVFKYNYKFKS